MTSPQPSLRGIMRQNELGRGQPPIAVWIAAGVLIFLVLIAFVPIGRARMPVLRRVITAIKKPMRGAQRPVPERPVSRPVSPNPWPTSAPFGTSKQPASRPAPSVPFTVNSKPTGATVKVNGTIVGKTPVTVKVAPGTHTVTVNRTGYAIVTRKVTVQPGKAGKLYEPLTAARTKGKVATKKPPVSAKARPVTVGSRAPAVALKDRSGRVHRLNDYWRSKQAVVLFVWSLDAQSQRLIRELDGRARSAAGRKAVVVVLNGDRGGVNRLVGSGKVKVPMLLGNQQIARAYNVPAGTPVAYLITQKGIVAQRQAKTIKFAPIFAQKPKPGGS